MLKSTVVTNAGVTQLVECLLPKQNVVGSSPITRSQKKPKESAKTAARTERTSLCLGEMGTIWVPPSVGLPPLNFRIVRACLPLHLDGLSGRGPERRRTTWLAWR
jgi:hypothetical protein